MAKTTKKKQISTEAELNACVEVILENEVEHARVDPNAFIEFVMEDDKTGKPIKQSKAHRELQEHITNHPLNMVKVHRYFGKSTQVVGRAMYESGRSKDLRYRISIVGSIEDEAKKRTATVKRYVETSRKLRAVFPDMIPSRDKWTDGELRFGKSKLKGFDANFTAYGIRGAGTGGRSDWIIADDIVDAEQKESKAKRDVAYDNLVNKFLPFIRPGDRFTSIYTPWHKDDANARLEKNPDHEGIFVPFVRAIGENFEPVWPEVWGEEALRQELKMIGTWAFTRSFRLLFISDKETLIKTYWIKFWECTPDGTPQIPPGRDYTAIDPAISEKKKACDSGFVSARKDKNANLYVTHCINAKFGTVDLLNMIRNVNDIVRPERIGIENTAFQDSLRQILIAESSIPVVGIGAHKDKYTRVSAFSVNCENSKIYLKGKRINGILEVHPDQKELYEQMTMFPVGGKIDLLDALVHCWNLSEEHNFVSRGKGKQEKRLKRKSDNVDMFKR